MKCCLRWFHACVYMMSFVNTIMYMYETWNYVISGCHDCMYTYETLSYVTWDCHDCEMLSAMMWWNVVFDDVISVRCASRGWSEWDRGAVDISSTCCTLILQEHANRLHSAGTWHTCTCDTANISRGLRTTYRGQTWHMKLIHLS